MSGCLLRLVSASADADEDDEDDEEGGGHGGHHHAFEDEEAALLEDELHMMQQGLNGAPQEVRGGRGTVDRAAGGSGGSRV